MVDTSRLPKEEIGWKETQLARLKEFVEIVKLCGELVKEVSKCFVLYVYRDFLALIVFIKSRGGRFD